MGVGVGVLAAVLAAGPWVVSPLVKVRPATPVEGARQARLSLARGECEAVQVVLPEGASRLEEPRLVLKGPGAALRASVWREAFIPVRTPSNAQGQPGLWPDALVPVSAPVEPAAPAVLYVELCAPAGQVPGTYRGTLRLKAQGRALGSVPFTARVQPFVLPATASLPTSFGFSLNCMARGHGLAPESPEARRLMQAYMRLLLEHRVSAHGLSMSVPPVRFEQGRAVVDFRTYDEEVGEYLSGKALPSGARATSAELRECPQARTPEEKVAWYRAFSEHFRQRGWSAQLFFYAKDEPKPEELPLVRQQAERVHAAGSVPVLVTSSYDEALHGVADILTPPINCFFPRPGLPTCPRVLSAAELRARLPPGTRVWWYQSCLSHGCKGGPFEDPALEQAYTGWASYMVDHPAPLQRAMGPLAFSAGVEGELYFDTVHAWCRGTQWEDLFAFGGNGDGTLLYPGTPARLGTQGHLPLPSLRLKHIRDGLEDYEYLHLLASLGSPHAAHHAARQLARSGYQIELDPDRWDQVRQQVTRLLRQRWEARGGKTSGPFKR